MKTTLINVASGSDAMSAISGLDGMSMDSGPDTEFNFGDMQSRAHKKDRPEDAAKDIDDIGDIGIGGGQAPGGSGLPPAADKRKQFSSYRKRLQQQKDGPSANIPIPQPVIKEDQKEEEQSIEKDIAGINKELEELEDKDQETAAMKTNLSPQKSLKMDSRKIKLKPQVITSMAEEDGSNSKGSTVVTSSQTY